VERGEPVRTLLSVAASREADLIVIATHGRSGVGAVWAGSVAQRIIAQSPRPVLLVRIGPV
jgi:nucleotide-binding universal stress UspA family protein